MNLEMILRDTFYSWKHYSQNKIFDLFIKIVTEFKQSDTLII